MASHAVTHSGNGGANILFVAGELYASLPPDEGPKTMTNLRTFSLVLIMLIQMVSPAAAGAPGNVLPSAHPVAKGSGEVEAVAGWNLGSIGTLQADHALTDRLLIRGSSSAYRLPFETMDGLNSLSTVGARYDLTPGDEFNVAPFMGMGLFYKTPYRQSDAGPRRWVHTLNLMGGVGVAIEGGTDRVRYDASLAMMVQRNLVGPTYHSSFLRLEPGPASRAPSPVEFTSYSISEVGITWLLSESHTLRLGGLGSAYRPLLPSLKYRHHWKKAFIGARVGFTQFVPSLGVSGGVQW